MWKLERVALLFLLLGGCEQRMRDQARHESQEKSAFFPDRMAARPPVEGTVARGDGSTDRRFSEGREGTTFTARFPFKLTRADVERGRERYMIFCAPCHDGLGEGRGMVVRRGFRAPPSLHDDRLRAAPVGQLFDVSANGVGQMPPYRSLVRTGDLWRIVAYVRALQLSRTIPLSDLSPDDRRAVEESRP